MKLDKKPMTESDEILLMVRDFALTFGHPVREFVNLADEETRRLRLSLLEEEAGELWEARKAGSRVGTFDALCDLQYVLDGALLAFGMAGLKARKVVKIQKEMLYGTIQDRLGDAIGDLSTALRRGKAGAVLTALCRIQVVIDRAFAYFNLAHLKLEGLREVHRSNMSKLGPDGKPIRRGDGKTLKGPNYSPPDLAGILLEDHISRGGVQE